MKVLNIKAKKANFETKQYETTDIIAVVASTKSENNLTDELKQQYDSVFYTAKDLFLDKEKTTNAILATVKEQIKDEQIQKQVVEHIKNVLEIGCLFYKPIVRNKK